MTREEAIEYLDGMKIVIPICNELKEFTDERNTAIDMAIEALSAEQHNKDAISREGLLRSWEELSPRGRTEFDQVIMTIPALPSADAVPWSVADKIGEDRKRLEERVSELEECLEWNPCSEKLPSDDDWVIVSIDYDRKAHGDNTVYWQNVTIAFYDGTWRSIESIGGESWVTAWMPLPKPYKGGDDE